ncbi:MAG: hypothetical protein ACI9LV_000841 [Candidatus Nanohaloarchaea archaeon]|jgi:hypothetical protein
MAVARDKNDTYSSRDSSNQLSRTIGDSEYNQLKDLEISETRDIGDLTYVDIYNGENRNESALNVRAIAGEEEPYHLTVTYHKLMGSEPKKDLLQPVEEIVGEIDIDRLLE